MTTAETKCVPTSVQGVDFLPRLGRVTRKAPLLKVEETLALKPFMAAAVVRIALKEIQVWTVWSRWCVGCVIRWIVIIQPMEAVTRGI